MTKLTKSDVAHYCAHCRERIQAGMPHFRDPETGRRYHRTQAECVKAMREPVTVKVRGAGKS